MIGPTLVALQLVLLLGCLGLWLTTPSVSVDHFGGPLLGILAVLTLVLGVGASGVRTWYRDRSDSD